MIAALILLPIVAGLITFGLRPAGPRRALLLAAAAGHAVLTALAWVHRPAAILDGWLSLDALGLLFLSITSALFLVVSIYALGYFRREDWGRRQDFQEGSLFTNARERTFTCCLLLFLGTMTLVTVSQHFGLLWVAVEATTLASAPLIYFHRHRRSLEATWKYLLICSVGIALALMGNLFLGAAGLKAGVGLDLQALLPGAPLLEKPLLKAAFLFLFVGYGTKMGLAPFHTWLPDAHSEAPAVVSALLSGALLNCAFLGIMRVNAVCGAAGLAEFTGGLLVLFGLVSVLTAALFMLGQRDYKRLLAYSSIEHMGIVALGTGLGGGAVFGALLGAVSHSLTKAGLFFTSGLVLASEKTKRIADVKGLVRRAPRTAALWLAGFFLITGAPPSGVFLAKFVILREALAGGHYWLAGTFLFFLAVLFAGMARVFIAMTFGDREAKPGERPFEEQAGLVVPAAAFFACVILAGLFLPGWLHDLLAGAAADIGGRI